jgi:hypothetical protein
MFDAGELPEMLQTAGYGGRIHRAAGNAQPRSFRCPNRQIVDFQLRPRQVVLRKRPKRLQLLSHHCEALQSRLDGGDAVNEIRSSFSEKWPI